jgi:hypothetical protein
MQEQNTVLQEYKFVSITGSVYHPIFKDSKWYLVGVFPRTLDNIVHLCNIPDEDAVFLKLKYGG